MKSIEGSSRWGDWITPAYVFEALGEQFDLDVAAPVSGNCHVPADRFISTCGLEASWEGFVWMNPPFGHQRTKIRWLDRFFRHGDGIALMPDRTSASWWQTFAQQADAILFVSPKIKFERPDGSIGSQPAQGTCLFAVGDRAASALVGAPQLGQVLVPPIQAGIEDSFEPNDAISKLV